MSERLLVLGAGMAGLFTALAFSPGEREIVIVERDPAPPDGGPEAAFADWHRRGVGQFRHSHGFLARMRNFIQRRHPTLIEALREAGCREIELREMTPVALRGSYEPRAGDDDLIILTSRRTTFELVVRRYVESLPSVSILSDTFVRDLIIEREAGGVLKVVGAVGERGGLEKHWAADVVVDAQGRLSPVREQLMAAGAAVPEDAENCGILYFTRHYRRLAPDPPSNRSPGTGDLDYIKYGRFPGDSGCFSITLAVPEIEADLRQAIVRPEIFDRICAELPGIAPWTAVPDAEPTSPVFGMGDLKSCWRCYVSTERRAALGLFAIGDSLIRTNPLYGRGCSFAAVEAEILRGVLDDESEPAVRARLYDARIGEALRPFYEDMREQDRGAIRRARRAMTPGGPPPLRTRVMQSFLGDGVRIAVRSDMELLREAMREFNMVDPPRAWLKRPGNMVKVVGRWARGRQANAAFYPPPLGPTRAEMMRALGLETDAETVAA